MIGDYDLFHILYGSIIFISMNALFAFNFIKTEQYRFFLSLSIVVLVSLFIGIRQDNIGLDSAQYAGIYMGTFERDGVEPLFLIMRFAFDWISNDYPIFFILFSLIINTFFLISFKKLTPYYPLAMSLFLATFLFINININVMRQALAMALAFYGAAALINHDLKRYWAFVVLACFAHYTASIFLLLYFLQYVKLSKKTLLLFLLICLLLLNIKFSDIFFYIKDLNSYFMRIYWYFNWNGLLAWHFKHIYYLVLLLILFYSIKYKEIDEKHKTLFIFYLYGSILVLLFKEEEMVADRIFYYFILFGILLIINIKNFIKENNFFYVTVWLGINGWLVKNIFIQFPNWFMPPFEGIRWAQ